MEKDANLKDAEGQQEQAETEEEVLFAEELQANIQAAKVKIAENKKSMPLKEK